MSLCRQIYIRCNLSGCSHQLISATVRLNCFTIIHCYKVSHLRGRHRYSNRLCRIFYKMTNQVSVQALLQAKISNGFCSIFRLLRSALRKDAGVSFTIYNAVATPSIQRAYLLIVNDVNKFHKCGYATAIL